MTTLIETAMRTPYKGLSPFDDSDIDALLFFGRAGETEVVVANALAARLTVLYGPSGVGKSSLLRAGVVHQLRGSLPTIRSPSPTSVRGQAIPRARSKKVCAARSPRPSAAIPATPPATSSTGSMAGQLRSARGRSRARPVRGALPLPRSDEVCTNCCPSSSLGRGCA